MCSSHPCSGAQGSPSPAREHGQPRPCSEHAASSCLAPAVAAVAPLLVTPRPALAQLVGEGGPAPLRLYGIHRVLSGASSSAKLSDVLAGWRGHVGCGLLFPKPTVEKLQSCLEVTLAAGLLQKLVAQGPVRAAQGPGWLTARSLPAVQSDERLQPLLNHLSDSEALLAHGGRATEREIYAYDSPLASDCSVPSHSYTGQDYSTQGNAGKISLDQIDSLSTKSFPPCMRQLHKALRENHHLRHGGRMQYGLFLKGIGLTLEQALQFWKQEFVRGKMDPDKWVQRSKRQSSPFQDEENWTQGKLSRFTHKLQTLDLRALGCGDRTFYKRTLSAGLNGVYCFLFIQINPTRKENISFTVCKVYQQ
ncbi:hypothetical protein CB1_025522025 [Camelus ferus]|nr:hypothetical protein CB1_025522025 [Camelus ferus]